MYTGRTPENKNCEIVVLYLFIRICIRSDPFYTSRHSHNIRKQYYVFENISFSTFFAENYIFYHSCNFLNLYRMTA